MRSDPKSHGQEKAPAGSGVPRMRIRLQFFGLVREAVGMDHAEIEIPDQTTVQDAVKLARGTIRGLKDAEKSKLRYAVNTEYAQDGSPLNDGDTLSFLPPVGGG